MAVFTETIKLEDQVSPAAKAAGNEAKVLSSALDSVSQSLIKAAATGDIGAFQKLTRDSAALKVALDQVDKGLLSEVATAKAVDAENAALAKSTKQAEADKAKASQEATQKQIAANTKMSNTLSAVKDAVGSAVAGMKSAFTSLAAGDVKGAIQGVTDSIAGMAKLLDLAVPGLGEAVAAVISIAGGLVGISVGLIQSGAALAISASQAKAAMVSTFDALGEGKISGDEVNAMLDGMSAKLGQTKESMAPLVQKFLAMGITSQDALEKMTTAALSAKALIGSAGDGAAAFENLSKKIQLASETGQGLKIPLKGLGSLAEMGLNVDDIARKMGISAKVLAEQLKAGSADASKFGTALQDALIEKGAGPLEKLGLSTKNLGAMLQQNLGEMFADLSSSVDPFLKEVKSLFGVFQKDAPSAKAMTAGIKAVFEQVFATATKLVPIVKHFLLDLVIWGLKAYIAVKPIVTAIKDFVTSAQGASIIGTILDSVWNVLKLIGVAVLVVVAVAIVLWAAMIAVSTAVWTAVGAILGFVADAGKAFDDWVAGAATAAYNFVAGLVSGITNGASQVIGAVKGLASSATGAFKSALGISSPSKVMAGMGGHMTDGVAQGLDDGAADVHAASTGVANASVKGMAAGSAGGGAGASGGGGGAAINVTVLIDGAGKSAEQITEEMVASVFQRVAMGAGLG